MNTEERQLAEMLHRVTPEPPRQVTVEDVSFRLADEAGRARGGYREPRARRGLGAIWGSGWTPVLAAASVFAVAGASAGIATVMTSHHSSLLGGGRPTYHRLDLAGLAPPTRRAVARLHPDRRRSPAGCGVRELINRQSLLPGSLTGSGGLAVRVRPEPTWSGSTRPPGTSCRRSGSARRSTEPAGHHGEHGVGGVGLQRRQRRPARLRRPDAGPGRVGAGARHRPGVQRGRRGCWPPDPTAISTWPRATPWRWWTRPPAT